MSLRKNAMMRIDSVGGLVALGMIAAVGFVAVAPIVSEQKEIHSRRLTLASIEKQTDEAQRALRTTASRLAEAKRQAAALPVQLGDRNDLNEKIAAMVDRCEQTDLAVQSILPGQPIVGARYTRTPIELTTRGVINDVARYLHAVHEESSDLEIVYIEIRGVDQTDQVDATIRAEWITLTN